MAGISVLPRNKRAIKSTITVNYSSGGRMKRMSVVAIALLCASVAQRGQSQEVSSPPEQIRKLSTIVGTFEGEATMTMGGKSMKGKIRHVNSSVSDGWGFLMDEVVTMEDGSTYKSFNIVGYDAGGGKVHVFSVTNAGETHDHKGSWTKPNAVSVQYDGRWEGKPYVEKAALTLDGPDAYTLSWNATLGGKTAGSGEEKLRRVSR